MVANGINLSLTVLGAKDIEILQCLFEEWAQFPYKYSNSRFLFDIRPIPSADLKAIQHSEFN